MDAFLFVVARCATAQSGALRWRAHVNSLPGQHNHRVGAHVQNGSARVQRQVQPPLARSRIFAPPGHCNYEVALGFGIGFGLAHTLGMSVQLQLLCVHAHASPILPSTLRSRAVRSHVGVGVWSITSIGTRRACPARMQRKR